MQATIKATKVEFSKTGSKKVITDTGTFWIKKSEVGKFPFEAGETKAVTYEPNTYKGNEYLWIKSLSGGDVAGQTASHNGNGHSGPEVSKRELWMARECALKCSVEMAKVEAEMLVPDAKEITDISEVQKKYYAEFLAEITK